MNGVRGQVALIAGYVESNKKDQSGLRGELTGWKLKGLHIGTVSYDDDTSNSKTILVVKISLNVLYKTIFKIGSMQLNYG